MASTIPALRGRFGSFEYFLTTMHVGELVRNITVPKELPGWENLSIEERYQRDISLTRVKKDIAPYFATDPHRFSSALILAVQNDSDMNFESLNDVANIARLPHLYKTPAENLGFVTLSGKEVFVPLDGQHRAKALQYAISGTDDNNVSLAGVPANTKLAEEDLAVILVRFDPEQSRKIFNKVNRYAKRTTKGENLITDDDDVIAVLSRRLLSEEGGLFAARLVRHESNTLSAKAPEFTTLATFYEANMEIVLARFPTQKRGEAQRVSEDKAELFREEIAKVWRCLMAEIELFAQAIHDESAAGDTVRCEIRRETLLGKPVAQLAVVRAFLLLSDRCKGVAERELAVRFNLLQWALGEEIWHGVLMNPNGRIMSGRTVVGTAALFIAHLCGAPLTGEEKKALIDQISGGERYELPVPVV